jgi:hypothetical protein
MNTDAHPMRFGATAAALVLATAVGGLLMGACGYAGQTRGIGAAPGGPILGLLGLWALTAAFIYAANLQWIGRGIEERIVRFVLCLVIALPFQLAVVTVGVNVFEGLGGRM